VVHAHFQAERLAGVRLGLAQAPGQFVPVVRHGDDPAAGKADELTRIRGLRVASGFVNELPGQLTIEVLHRAGGWHGSVSPRSGEQGHSESSLSWPYRGHKTGAWA